MILHPKASFAFAFVSAFILLVSVQPMHADAVGVGIDGVRSGSIAPYKIPFSSLDSAAFADADAKATSTATATQLLLNGLTNNGLVSITNLPNNFRETKVELLSTLHDCLMSIEEDGDTTTTNANVPTEHLLDGTIRRSFATLTLPNDKKNDGGIGYEGSQPIHSLENFLESSTPESNKVSCLSFQHHLASFRATVDMVTTAFAQQLSLELEPYLPKPLLHSATRSINYSDYLDFAHTVAGGEHLEHFHSYQKQDVAGRSEDEETQATTIELHTDQGLFIAFTPGLLLPVGEVGETAKQPLLLPTLSKGLHIQDSNGKNFMVEFTDEDDLVFMMGDAVNQVINDQLLHGHTGLRATPHALVLDSPTADVLARVWYGRMVLPPNDAYSPALPNYTFGKLRQSLVHSASHGEDVPLGIGCSSPTQQAVIAATSRRSLSEEGHDEAITCAQDELFCWFGCMSLPEYNISSVYSCAERNLSLECMNPRGQVHENGMEHGDFFPACTDRTHETHPVTPFPTIDQQDENACTSDLWTEFLMEDSYDHKATLTRPNGTETILLWSIVDSGDGSKKLNARLVFDNVFGWLAIGFANPNDPGLNGMLGANILLAMPGGNYSAATGMDLNVDGSVATYKIDEADTAFRHWQTPIDNDETRTTVAGFEETDCFTALTFESDHINGQKFTLDGTDDMVWAGNHNDIWMAYHGPFDRSRFVIDWTKDDEVLFSGEENLGEAETEPETSDPTTTVDAGATSGGGPIRREMFGMASLAFAVAAALMLDVCAF